MIFGNKSRTTDFDLLILGGGSAAFAAAIRAVELGAKVGVIEAGTIGGTCVNRGCVPSKNLLHAAEVYWTYRKGSFPGLPRGSTPVDFRRVIEQKRELVKDLRRAKYWDVLEAHREIRFLGGRARFVAPNEVIVSRDHDNAKYSAGKFVVATGASAQRVPVEGLDEIEPLNYETAMELEEPPQSLIVIGGGPIGLELGQMFSRFGSQVNVLELMPQILPAEDPEIAARLACYLQEEGIQIHTNVRVRRARRDSGEAALEAEMPSGIQEFRAEKVLLAAGLKPNTSDLGLEAAGVVTDNRGFIRVDSELRTTARHVWAAGDCTGTSMLVTVAAQQGQICAENALKNKRRKFDGSSVPHAVFTFPEVASVGLKESEAVERRMKIETKSISFEHVPKAAAVRNTRGLLKLVVDGTYYRILGAHLVSDRAADLIHIGVLAVQNKLTVGDLLRTTFVYPTLAEAFKIAAISFKKDVSKLSCCAQ